MMGIIDEVFKMRKELAALLFDHDGTLVDSEVVHHKIWQSVLTDFNIPLPFNDFIINYIGISSLETSIKLKEQYDMDISASALDALKGARTREHLETNPFPLLPGVKKTIEHFTSRNVKIAIVSGSNRDYVLSSLKAYDLENSVDVVSTGEDVTVNKPSPEIYQFTVNKLNADPENCIAIEDSKGGIKSAVSAGIFCIGIQHSFTKVEDLEQADMVFNNHDEIRDYLISSCVIN